MIRSPLFLAGLATAALLAVPVQAQPAAAPMAAPGRPAEDKARDADRKPTEMLRFAGVKPGMTVVDILPGGGYFTRLFAAAVGPRGRVIAYVPEEMLKTPKAVDRLNGLAAIGPNVQLARDPLLAPPPGAIVDVVWTSQNYHDIHNLPGVDMVAFNKAIFASLKPGGRYVVLDHAARAGSGVANTKDLHRIDPAAVKAEVIAAGFVYDGESRVLANPADDHSLNVMDPGLRGHTDQFVYRFRKPK